MGEAPKQITGQPHLPGDRCNCGCGRAWGRTGYLRENSDTPKLALIGVAVYDFPAEPPHSAVSVSYTISLLAELGCLNEAA